MNEWDMEQLVTRITYKEHYGLRFGITDGRPFLQVTCVRADAITGDSGVGRGGKVFLSNHMVESEIVRKAFQAFAAYEEHECREWFRYEGAQVFGPHIDIRALIEAANKKSYR